ncbi:hypothetical protein Rs2_09157 [Raphanus sativus]|nr:hypothetical protein Rs2_09157 [Raphanus sativus]
MHDLDNGKKIHCDIVKAPCFDNIVLTCLVDMYAKCGEIESCCRVFDGIALRNVVFWTSMIAGYNYQASPVSERSCPWNFQANLKVFSTKKNKRYVYAHHTTLGDPLGSSHIVDDMENQSRFSEEILRCISSMYITLSGRARTSSCIQASPSSKTRFNSWNPCLGDSKEANAPRGVVIESLKLHLDDSCFNNL